MVARRPLVLGALTAVLVLGGCEVTPPGTDEEGSMLPSGGDNGVLVYTDVAYAAAPAGWVRPVLDLYLPAEAGEPPLAVVVPDAGRIPGGATTQVSRVTSRAAGSPSGGPLGRGVP